MVNIENLKVVVGQLLCHWVCLSFCTTRSEPELCVPSVSWFEMAAVKNGTTNNVKQTEKVPFIEGEIAFVQRVS